MAIYKNGNEIKNIYRGGGVGKTYRNDQVVYDNQVIIPEPTLAHPIWFTRNSNIYLAENPAENVYTETLLSSGYAGEDTDNIFVQNNAYVIISSRHIMITDVYWNTITLIPLPSALLQSERPANIQSVSYRIGDYIFLPLVSGLYKWNIVTQGSVESLIYNSSLLYGFPYGRHFASRIDGKIFVINSSGLLREFHFPTLDTGEFTCGTSEYWVDDNYKRMYIDGSSLYYSTPIGTVNPIASINTITGHVSLCHPDIPDIAGVLLSASIASSFMDITVSYPEHRQRYRWLWNNKDYWESYIITPQPSYLGEAVTAFSNYTFRDCTIGLDFGVFGGWGFMKILSGPIADSDKVIRATIL